MVKTTGWKAGQWRSNFLTIDWVEDYAKTMCGFDDTSDGEEDDELEAEEDGDEGAEVEFESDPDSSSSDDDSDEDL